MRARHAPRMTEHPDLDLPAARAPALEIALARSATISPAAKLLAGLAPPSVEGVARAAFAPAPLTVLAGVTELAGGLPALEMLELLVPGPSSVRWSAASPPAGPTRCSPD
jgi:hypothetical protein